MESYQYREVSDVYSDGHYILRGSGVGIEHQAYRFHLVPGG